MKRASMIKFEILIIAIMQLLSVGCLSSSNRLTCNIGVADITPTDSVKLAGFAARKGLSKGIHMPLETHCLAIKKGNSTVCIITNDLMEISIPQADSIRKEISLKTGIPMNHILIHNTHTHSAPRVGGSWVKKGAPNYEYMQHTFSSIIDNAVGTINDKKAYKSFEIEYAIGHSNMNINRGEANLPVDDNVYVVRLLGKDKKTIVSFVNYACHPVSLGPKSAIVSPDFPGTVVRSLEAVWGGRVFYFTGASGNINPRIGIKASTDFSEENGKLLTQSLNNIQFTPIKDIKSLSVFSKVVKLPFEIEKITKEAVKNHAEEIMNWDMFPTWRSDVENWCQEICDKIDRGDVQNYLPIQINAVKIGGLIMLFSQGEPFNEYQINLRKKFVNTPILFMGYTNGQNSYIPGKNAYMNSAYDYETKQMHIYIKAPYPLSSNAPVIYESNIENLIKEITKCK